MCVRKVVGYVQITEYYKIGHKKVRRNKEQVAPGSGNQIPNTNDQI